ncbi:helix-turn-helix domain-containing protein [Nitrospinae bacterium AH_259_B05_G02_I21]|nr:helix-turn-helix domain-containing protein [Nitrospinae bacterium AH_259_B05_G02_I21]
MTKRLLTQKEAATYLGMSLRKFQDVKPALPVPMPGRMLRYDRLDLDAWVEQQKQGGEKVRIERMADELVKGVLN